jgi:hypothetical protein
MKLGMCIMTPEPISTVCFINPSHQFVCLYVYAPTIAIQRLGNVTAAARKNRRIGGHFVFYTVRDVSKESKRLVLPRASYSATVLFMLFIYVLYYDLYGTYFICFHLFIFGTWRGTGVGKYSQ